VQEQWEFLHFPLSFNTMAGKFIPSFQPERRFPFSESFSYLDSRQKAPE